MPGPGHVAEVVQPAGSPVDEGDGHSAGEDRVERPGVAVQEAFPARGEGVSGSEVVQLPEHHGPARVAAVRALAGMIGGLAGDIGQDVLAAVIDAEVARRIRAARRLQVAEQPRGGRAPRVSRAADRVTDADDLAGVPPAVQWFFAHQPMVPSAGPRSRFNSAGVGVSVRLAMVMRVDRTGRRHTLHALRRSAARTTGLLAGPSLAKARRRPVAWRRLSCVSSAG
jgi:hypothetical protein